MRKFLIVILTLTFAGLVFSQTEKDIILIRNEVNSINTNLAGDTKKSKNINDISAEGAEATYYISGKDIRKISAKVYGETFNANVEFYYSDDKLIFAFEKFDRYDTQIGVNSSPKVIKTEERRYYFSGGNLIRLLVGKKDLKPDEENYSELKDGIIETSNKLKDAYE